MKVDLREQMNFREIQENMDEIKEKEQSKHGRYTLSHRVIGSDLRNNQGLYMSDAYGKKTPNHYSSQGSRVPKSRDPFPDPIK